jgi:hypothetical protein
VWLTTTFSQYSTLEAEEKARAIALWRKRWTKFLEDIAKTGRELVVPFESEYYECVRVTSGRQLRVVFVRGRHDAGSTGGCRKVLLSSHDYPGGGQSTHLGSSSSLLGSRGDAHTAAGLNCAVEFYWLFTCLPGFCLSLRTRVLLFWISADASWTLRSTWGAKPSNK